MIDQERSFPALEDIPFPECVQPYLKHLDERHQSVRVEHLPELAETGRIATWQVPEHLWREYLIHGTVEQLNDVIAALNILIADVEQLPSLVGTLRGLPSVRIDLLERSFHNEVYRGREIIRRGMGALRRRGFLDKADARGIAQAIDDHLGDGFKLRNVLAHGEGFLITKERTAVRAVERSLDDLVLTLEDGSEITVSMFVKRLSEEVGSTMRK